MSIHSYGVRRRLEQKIRKQERKEHALRETRMQESATNIVIKLTRDCGLLPSGLLLALPEDISNLLIMRRLAIPVASFEVMPDAAFTIEDLDHADLESELFPTWHLEQVAS